MDGLRYNPQSDAQIPPVTAERYFDHGVSSDAHVAKQNGEDRRTTQAVEYAQIIVTALGPRDASDGYGPRCLALLLCQTTYLVG